VAAEGGAPEARPPRAVKLCPAPGQCLWQCEAAQALLEARIVRSRPTTPVVNCSVVWSYRLVPHRAAEEDPAMRAQSC
jgi:hypothetical protein